MALLKKPGKKKFFIVRLQALGNACKFLLVGVRWRRGVSVVTSAANLKP